MGVRELFPPIEPFNSGFLKVSSLHTVYYEEVGNKAGVPALFLHGGPGGGLSADYRRFFDPAHYRVVLMDQRGAGKSTPQAESTENGTWELVGDIERLRKALGIGQWIVFGGSWGSTLGLAYAVTHPERVLGLILRGIFLCRRQEIDWFYQSGASHSSPTPGRAIWRRSRRKSAATCSVPITAVSPAMIKRRACAAPSPGANGRRRPPCRARREDIRDFDKPERALALARIECHFFKHKTFFTSDNFLLENVPRIRHIPGIIIHGR